MTTPINDDQPIRLYKSSFLEALTFFTPIGVVLLWTPVVLLTLYLGIASSSLSEVQAVLAYVGGVFLWTFVEYLIHRFLFHGNFKTKFMQDFQYKGHTIHHLQPMFKKRLVMPPLAAIPTAAVLYMLLWVVVRFLFGLQGWTSPIFAGMITGYIFYDLLHYSYHHAAFKGKLFNSLRVHHMRHHGIDKTGRYGVSSPIWDYVFGSMPSVPKKI